MNYKNTYETSSFFIYDYETFGKNPASDKPAQFAGIRTDYNFNPISKPENFFCRLPNDYLPNPEAVLITEINPINALNIGIQEYQFAQRIQKIFCTPQTCILGYNNIRFDNEFTRNIFYRNFYDPYTWSWKNKNSNWDLLNIMKAYYALRPEGITWPLNNKGTPSFRLMDLSNSNNITHNKSHDALSDVYATLELAKLTQHTQPRLFNYLYHHRKKSEIKKLINITNIQPLVYVPINNIINNRYAILIKPLAWHTNNSNILIACNLNENLDKLWKNNINYIPCNKQMINFYHQNKHRQHTILTIHINKCPILAPISSLRPQDISRLNIDLQYCLNNAKKLQNNISNNKEIIKKTIITFQNNYDYLSQNTDKTLHVDNQLYTGFFNKSDRHMINIIRKESPENLNKIHTKFYDKRLKPLLFYYRARNFPHTLTQYEKQYWLEYRKTLFTKIILTQYKEQLDQLFETHKKNTRKINILNSLIKYLQYINDTLNQ
ncbi:exodeoxyribonuclease I [Blochmannia endosymbiont of Polyrhachis (Hedomyrma) turneri]|uniref:exodeoxyribonuclease I n=1 Tax=Blochmannia endosymbiont of Polyrhachis (Hedomyrma) turneri TaxID=1505596 RepID=UPI00061A8486|nr:exodeoxyribonuclease I [Blochmannia endosymbiont of Polyrhachis (Hedomyrma) turneri]AKC60023.1 Exodeoxyribonuclease I [Blochmannia endosymbiont of Polyrhachis (Hedomyrma) turneri]